jgi:hypothetical protein
MGSKMKFIGFLALFITSVILISCESDTNSVLSADNSSKIYADSHKDIREVGKDILDLDDVIIVNKEIDGSVGGEITLDTLYTGSDGNVVFIKANISFEPNSFEGIKNISMSPDPISGSIKFTPAMTFNLPAKLDLNFMGINLSRLGFDHNSTVDFVYRADDGTTQFILKNECKIKWDTKELYVKKAELPHFSRYVFVRKSN